jgi:hypothetical protein
MRLASLVPMTLAPLLGLAAPAALPAERPGVPPLTPWVCPGSHPIKGYLAEGASRVYFLPENPFYDEASPERCYASEDEARRDGSQPARPPRPPAEWSPDLAGRGWRRTGG